MKGNDPAKALNEFFDTKVDGFGCDCATAVNLIRARAIAQMNPKMLEGELNFVGPSMATRNAKTGELTNVPIFENEPMGGEAGSPIPGDLVGFSCPDCDVPAWRNENTIYLGNYKKPGQYYGMGVGIVSASKLEALQKKYGEAPPNAKVTQSQGFFFNLPKKP